jgi:Ca2+-binding EF-hand superfamily protein
MLLVLLLVLPAASAEPARATPDAQDFVFLGETRPVLIRLHAFVDGKSLQAAWDDFMKYLFNYLDVDGDGVLSKEEAERAPAVDLLRGGLGGGILGGRGAAPAAGPTLDALDANKDGKVTLAELSAWYRKNGFGPFQFQFSSAQGNPIAMGAALLNGGRSEPSASAVSEAIFNLLDTNQDGRLTKEKLAVAPTILLRLDEDEDEMIVPRELVPNAANPLGNNLFAGFMMARGGTQANAGNHYLVPITTPGEAPPNLVKTMHDRYGPKVGKQEVKKLTRKDLGLDEETFAKLDSNSDGVLDSEELAGFVKRAPDLELIVRLGKKAPAEAMVEVVKGSPLAGMFRAKTDLGMLNLGKVRVDLSSSEGTAEDRFSGLLRDQYLAQFRQMDADNKGFISESQVANNRLLRGLFKQIDRDGEGKVTEKKLLAFLDHLQELQKRAASACVHLNPSDQNRGLFDVLDTDGDGRLSVREMRGAVKLLEQLDNESKGYLTKADIPHMYRLTLHQGPASGGGFNNPRAFLDLYGGANQAAPDRPGRGPLWFRKMDRNRDGDVSRKEWLWSEELFRKIDTDGDGLISVAEAEAFDALMRKQGKQLP